LEDAFAGISCVVDGMEAGFAGLYQNLHGSTTLLFEAMASQAIADANLPEYQYELETTWTNSQLYTEAGAPINPQDLLWTPTFSIDPTGVDYTGSGGGAGDTLPVIGAFLAPMANGPLRAARSMSSVRALPPPPPPVHTGKYWDYFTCGVSELIIQGFGNDERAFATVGLNVAPFVLAETPPLAYTAALLAGAYDLGLAARARATCGQEVYGHP
jgi:hypothetical protein